MPHNPPVNRTGHIRVGDHQVAVRVRRLAPAHLYSFEELLAQHKALGLDPDREWLEFSALSNEKA